jgi:formylglycine-generating enzyme required for sulfatase activity
MRTLLSCFLVLVFFVNLQAQPSENTEMVFVKGGEFDMGCTDKQYSCHPDEKPVHPVSVNDFYISKYEITNAEYCRFLNDIDANPGGSYYGFEYIQIGSDHCMIYYKNDRFVVAKGKENHPVVEVTWYGAKAFCHWADGRLPTEAEWEYAARGGQQQEEYIFSGSDTVGQVAWYKHNYYMGSDKKFTYREGTLPVGRKHSNSLGLYDMSGNVWEFCNDWYAENYYENSPSENPTGPSHSYHRVKRGGSFKNEAAQCRVTNREKSVPGYSQPDVGFRLVKDIPDSESSTTISENEDQKEKPLSQ